MNPLKLYPYFILDRYKDLKKSNKTDYDNYELSKIFEYYSAIKLSEKYNTIFFEYNDIPIDFKEQNDLTRIDSGIDLCNLTDSIVQCKLRKNILNWTECSNFFGSQNKWNDTLEKTEVRWPHLFITRNLDSRLSENLSARKKLFKDITFSKSELIDYCENLYNNPPIITENNKPGFTLRCCQDEDIKRIIENKCNLTMCNPTGTGKNILIIYSIPDSENLKDRKFLILVPRIILMDQLKEELLSHKPFLKNKIQYIGDGKNEFDTNKNITICVYNSINIIKDHLKSFEKIYIDEAHHIYNNSYLYQSEDNEDDEEKEDEEKKDSYINTIRSLSKYNNNVLLSATIDPVPGFKYYKRDLREMIEQGFLSDYNIILPIFEEDPSDKSVCKYLIKKHRNLIIYCHSTVEGKKIKDIMNEILPNSTEYIDCETKKTQRKDILRRYKNGEIGYLVNVQILTEGFDAPITKSVCFLHMPSSQTKASQVVGRALRLHPDKTVANVILPYSKNSDGKDINKFLSIISNNDSRIKKSYTSKKLGGYINLEDIIKTDDNEIDEKEENDTQLKSDVELKREMIMANMGRKILTPVEKGEILLKFIIEKGIVPKCNEVMILPDGTEFKIGIFYNHLKQGNNKEVLDDLLIKNDIIKKDYEEFLKKKESKKDKKEYTPVEKGEILLKFIIEKGIVPTRNEVMILPDGTEIKIGQFYDSLKHGHNKEVLDDLINKNDIIKKDYEEFLKKKESKKDKKEYTPVEKGEILLKFIIEKGIVPKCNEVMILPDGTEIKIGQFYNSLKHGFNKEVLDDLINKNDIIKKDYEEFLKNREIDNKQVWKDKLEKVKSYILENNKRPSDHNKNKDIRSLGHWLSDQIANYKKKVQIIKETDIREIWEDFINADRFKKYFK